MSDDTLNEIVLNIPAMPGDDPPHPDEPVLKLNGHPINEVKSIAIEASGGQLTLVTIQLYARVYGTLSAHLVKIADGVPAEFKFSPKEYDR